VWFYFSQSVFSEALLFRKGMAIGLARVGLPDGWYFTGLAGILLLIWQRPVF